MRSALLFGLLLLFSLSCRWSPAFAGEIDYAAEARRLLNPLIENEMLVGCSVGLYKDGHSYYAAAGKTALEGDGVTPDENTIYEIGSISKVFTALLLADLARSGLLKIDDPASAYMPQGVKVPSFEGREISLLHLAQHSSGLPRMPDNFSPRDERNPYADYMNEQLYEFLASYKLTRSPGESFEYSNVGAGLLGHILELAAKKDYETLLKERICAPLGLSDTKISVGPRDFGRLARPYGPDCRLNRNWDLGALKGAGGIRSSVRDMLAFGVAAMQQDENAPLAATFAESMRHERESSAPDTRTALGWHIKTNKAGDRMYWHNGQTGGYHSLLMLNPSKKLALVALANTGSPLIDSLGAELMRLLEHGQAEPLPLRKAIEIPAESLKKYEGTYYLSSNFAIHVTAEGPALIARASGQDSFRIYPESETRWFYRVVDADIDFVINEKGLVESLVLHQNGADMPGSRTPPSVPEASKNKLRQEIRLDPARLAQYVGKYKLAPDFIITISVEDGKLYAQASGQERFPVFPSSESTFFYKAVDAVIQFVRDENGAVEKLLLHQGGLVLPAPKTE